MSTQDVAMLGCSNDSPSHEEEQLANTDAQHNVHATERKHRTLRSVRDLLKVGIVPVIEFDCRGIGTYLLLTENEGDLLP